MIKSFHTLKVLYYTKQNSSWQKTTFIGPFGDERTSQRESVSCSSFASRSIVIVSFSNSSKEQKGIIFEKDSSTISILNLDTIDYRD